MIGKEELDNEVESALKVTDKRKFNVDGSLREGIKLEKQKPETKKAVEPVVAQKAESEAPANASADMDISETKDQAAKTENEPTKEEVMNDENPASFVNFLSTLVANAATALGAMQHPVTGQKSVDLDTGKYWIDILAMLREKTTGNLNSQEQRLLESILSDLQMQFVALNHATEEKLKAQAAQKFSSKDILGG